MTALTNRTACHKTCPVRGDGTKNCIGDQCMAWEWLNDGYEYYLRMATETRADENNCFKIKDGEELTRYLAAGWHIHVVAHRSHINTVYYERLRRALPSAEIVGRCNYVEGRLADVEVHTS